MAYNELLAERIRKRFQKLKNVEEKAMMGGLCFMYNDKMCVGIFKDQLMCRIDPATVPGLLKRKGAQQMDMSGRVMKGYLLIDESGMKKEDDFDFWISQCLEFNKHAKASRKKK